MRGLWSYSVLHEGGEIFPDTVSALLLAPGSLLLAPGSWLLAPGSWLLALQTYESHIAGKPHKKMLAKKNKAADLEAKVKFAAHRSLQNIVNIL